jgi:hypothetical protein
VVARAFFLPAADDRESNQSAGIAEAPISCLIALSLTALLCIALFFGAGGLERMLGALFTQPAAAP